MLRNLRWLACALCLGLHISQSKPASCAITGDASIAALTHTALEAKDYGARSEARFALARLGPSAAAALPTLTAALRSSTEQRRVNAVQALQQLGPLAGPAVDDLAACYGDTSRQVRFVVGEALFQIHHPTPASIRALVQELHDPEMPPALNASTALGVLGGAAVPAVRGCLHDGKAQVRLFAVYALQGIGQPAFDALLEAQRDTTAAVRGAAMMGLARISPRTPEVESAIRKSLQDADPELRAITEQVLAAPPPPVPTQSTKRAPH